MSLIGNPDTPSSYVDAYMQATVGLFGIPAGGFVTDIEDFGAATNWNVESLYAALLNSSIGRSIYSPGASNNALATKLVTMLGGSLLSDALRGEIIDLAESRLTDESLAAVAKSFVDVLANLDTTDPDYGPVALQYANRINIAGYYTFSTQNPATSLSALTVILSGVTDTTDVSDPQKVIEETTPGLFGQTFTLTDSPDTVAGTSGNDTIVAGEKYLGLDSSDTKVYQAHLQATDVINGGAGTDTLKVTTEGAIAATLPTMSGVEIVELASGSSVAFNTSNYSDVTMLKSTKSTTSTLTAGSTTDISISGASNTITAKGGNNVTISDATANTNIVVGDTVTPAYAAGNISVTDTKLGTGTITIDGGKDVTVNTTVTAAGALIGGAIGIGATKDASGAVAVTQNLNSDATGAATGSAITVNGGTSVSVTTNLTVAAKDATATGNAQTFGAVVVTSDDSTKSVSVSQVYAETEFTKAATAVVKETSVVTFGALKSGETLIVNGLTFTAAKDLTAAEVAAAFANLSSSDTQSSGGVVTYGTYSGAFSTAVWTSGAASGTTVTFTAQDEDETDLAFTGTGTTNDSGTRAPSQVKTAGTAAAAATTTSNSATYDNVTIDEKSGTTAPSIESVTLNGYATANLGATDNLNAIKTLSLANSAGTASLYTSATTLGLTLNNVKNTVTLDAAAATVKTLNVTTTGADSSFTLTAAAVETLSVAGDKKVTFGADLVALKTVTVTGSASLALSGNEGNTLTSVNSSGTTGAVTATIDGTLATYTGGAGVDTVTLATGTALTKAIDLGAGNDTLVFSAAVTGSTAALSGGDGTDTLSMTIANADSLDASTQTFYTNFERLLLNSAAGDTDGTEETVTIDLANLGFTNYVTTNGTTLDSTTAANADILKLTNMASGGTVVLTAAAAGANTKQEVAVKDASTGTADVLNVETKVSTVNINFGKLTVANVETINLTATDSNVDEDSDGTTYEAGDRDTATLKLVADTATTLTITGNSSLTLDASSSTKLTSIDGSAMTGVLTVTTSNSTSATTVKGGSGADALTAKYSQDVLEGGDGGDSLIVLDGANLVTLKGGAGVDTYTLGEASNSSGYATIQGTTAELSGDVIKFDTAIASFTAAKIVLADTAVFQDYANEATKGTTADNAASWFQYGGNTYVVQNNSTSSSFANGVDSIVKIVGLVDFTFNSSSGNLEIA